MTAQTVEIAIHELTDLARNDVQDLIAERGLPRDGLFVDDQAPLRSSVEDLTRHTVGRSPTVGVLFADTRRVDAIVIQHAVSAVQFGRSCYFQNPSCVGQR